MPKKEYISKNYALYLVNYFGNMQTWSKEDVISEIKRKIAEANESFLDTENRGCTYVRDKKSMTNYERIKAMSVEEMAAYFCIGGLPICPLNAPHCHSNECPKCFKRWLESEAKE